MTFDPEELRGRFLSPPEGAGAAQDCPAGERYLQAVLGELPPRENRALADHAAGCPACAIAWRLARDYAEEAELEPTSVARPGRSRMRFVPAAAAIAAAAVLAVALLTWRGASVAPSIEERGAHSGEIAIDPGDGTTLAAAPERLSWAPHAGAESYRVVLYDFESTPLWSSAPVTATSVALPQELRAELRPGRAYYWRVTAQAGLEPVEGPLHRFTITP